MSVQPLFEPFRLKSLVLPNCFVMAPMTRSFSPDGKPTLDVASYYRRRAENDVGLMLSEGTVVDRPAASNDPAVPHFYGKEALEAWGHVAEGVHRAGGAMAPQLWHMGVAPNHASGWTPPAPFEGPSDSFGPGLERRNGRAMTEADIESTIKAFAAAAGAAKRLGFAALEVHGAHGYLIDQFFWAATNTRDDQWGGKTLGQRTRFAVHVLRAVRAEVGDDFPIIMRLSQFKPVDYGARMAVTPKEMEAWLAPLAEAGADILHCSQRRFWEPEFAGSDLNFAGWAKKITGLPTITVGSVGLDRENPQEMDDLVARMERGDFDLVAVGRALLADPAWVTKVKQGKYADMRDFHPDDLHRLF